MPMNTAPQDFFIGQVVVFLPTMSDYSILHRNCVIIPTLPGDDFGRTYSALSVADEFERVFTEPQLRADSA